MIGTDLNASLWCQKKDPWTLITETPIFNSHDSCLIMTENVRKCLNKYWNRVLIFYYYWKCCNNLQLMALSWNDQLQIDSTMNYFCFLFRKIRPVSFLGQEIVDVVVVAESSKPNFKTLPVKEQTKLSSVCSFGYIILWFNYCYL